MYKNTRNGKVVINAEFNEKFKTYTLTFEDGTSTSCTTSTFKRWYKKIENDEDKYVAEVMQQKKELGIECPPITEVVTVECAGDGTPLTEVGKEIAEQAKAKATKAKQAKVEGKKTSKKTTERKKKEAQPYMKDSLQFVFSKVEALGDEIFVPEKATGMRAFKVGGHMYVKFNYSCNSMTLAISSKSFKDKDVITPSRKVNHLFDNLYVFDRELTKADKDLIVKLLKVARNYRIEKNNNSKKKEDK